MQGCTDGGVGGVDPQYIQNSKKVSHKSQPCCYDPPPIEWYFYLSDPPIPNENIFNYPINNSIEKETAKLLRDRNIIIANVV